MEESQISDVGGTVDPTTASDVVGFNDGDDPGGARRNERSTIAFPYSPLSDAEEVAAAVFEWGGHNVPLDQIASALKTTITSSSFRTKLATARIFGVVDGRGSLSLSPLGRRLLESAEAPAARVEAFLRVPLFKAVFERHRGQLLPPAKGLAQEIQRLGVSSKQSERARQTLVRSAEHAGLFSQGRDRLVLPNLANGDERGRTPAPSDIQSSNPGSSTPDPLPPTVSVLLATLLREGEAWPAEAVKAMLDAARALYRQSQS